MRLTNPGSSRPQLADRAPVNQALEFAGVVNDSVTTTRATRTVPAGRKGIINAITVSVECITAPATPAFFIVRITVNGTVVYRVQRRLTNVNDHLEISGPLNVPLVAADVVVVDTSFSIGGAGSANVGIAANQTEFDA